jgi:hypothetical protein
MHPNFVKGTTKCNISNDKYKIMNTELVDKKEIFVTVNAMKAFW